MLLIPCPHCGARDENEFAYGGDANVRRPGPEGTHNDWMNYIFLRDNPKGRHRELWFHGLGCRRWLEVERDTMTHEIFTTVDAATTRAGAIR
jgi:methylglutamate dehydrogenase subunit B